jgi:hypothetical protein
VAVVIFAATLKIIISKPYQTALHKKLYKSILSFLLFIRVEFNPAALATA